MELTININAQPSKIDAFLNFIKSLDFIEVTNIKKSEETLNPQQKKFKKKLFNALNELNEAREGKVKLGNLDDLLNEI
ncbi:hypothetical protein [Capnocytophaga sputigena]|jgi:hypothetical protein|uniref:Uncharacterized protein n=1 Tax=Capnocytophaga sputigena TaxID=1019 RepID=A0AAX2IDI9_CAPSP|nr:hypothetical protein [Capnocytophaga sputigena]ATA85001.1 hypothetical protein CGC55_11080 [Capnocytophaga sputigena]EEB64861.1 hypothetical protein CAPSP0001_2560 [Capnocytophaga sputigena ATCC 33612]SQA76308.1 Uncharacterised protein [Capnocytophaga sputigena]